MQLLKLKISHDECSVTVGSTMPNFFFLQIVMWHKFWWSGSHLNVLKSRVLTEPECESDLHVANLRAGHFCVLFASLGGKY